MTTITALIQTLTDELKFVSIHMPQCRFTLSHQHSIPGVGVEPMGLVDDGIFYKDRLLANLPRDDYAYIYLLRDAIAAEGVHDEESYQRMSLYTPAALLSLVYYPAEESYWDFDGGDEPTPIEIPADIQFDGFGYDEPSGEFYGIIHNTAPSTLFTGIVTIHHEINDEHHRYYGFATNPVQDDVPIHTRVTITLIDPLQHIFDAGVFEVYLGNAFTLADDFFTIENQVVTVAATVFLDAQLFAAGGGRVRVMASSYTWFTENRDDAFQMLFVQPDVANGQVGTLTLLDENGNNVNTAGFDADTILQFTQWPESLLPVFGYTWDEALNGGNGGPVDADLHTVRITNELDELTEAGARRTSIQCDVRDPIINGPLSPFGYMTTERPLGKRTMFLPPPTQHLRAWPDAGR